MPILHEVLSSDTAVWVNDPFGAIGRFGRHGSEVHRSMLEQLESGIECLACSHGDMGEDDWQEFRRLMKLHYEIDVPDDARPGFLRSG